MRQTKSPDFQAFAASLSPWCCQPSPALVWLKQPGNQPDQQKVIDAIHAFAKEIPEVTRASVGRTDGIGGPFSDTSYDLCFILTFESEAARLRYNEHPTHQKAAQEVFLPLAKKLLFYRFVAE